MGEKTSTFLYLSNLPFQNWSSRIFQYFVLLRSPPLWKSLVLTDRRAIPPPVFSSLGLVYTVCWQMNFGSTLANLSWLQTWQWCITTWLSQTNKARKLCIALSMAILTENSDLWIWFFTQSYTINPIPILSFIFSARVSDGGQFFLQLFGQPKSAIKAASHCCPAPTAHRLTLCLGHPSTIFFNA